MIARAALFPVFLTILAFFGFVRPALAEFALTILHTNDVHGRFEETDHEISLCSPKERYDGKCYGGSARLYTAIEDVRQNVEHSVLVDAGDQFQGSLLFQRYQGELTADLMNMMGYNVMTLGNHEFGAGLDTLRRFLDTVRFPVVIANGDFSNEPILAGQVAASHVQVISGHNVGFIGVIAQDTDVTANLGPSVTFGDPAFFVGREVAILTARGVDKIIVLSHLGYSEDKALAEKVDGIDVIVGGHSHTFLHNDHIASAGPYPTMVGQTAIVQAFAFGQYLGRLDVVFDSEGQVQSAQGDPIILDQWVPENPFIASRVDRASKPLNEMRRNVVGEAERRIDEGPFGCRRSDCPLGILVAEAMLVGGAPLGAEVAILNSGSIKTVLTAGPITMADVRTALPFNNTLSTFKLSGQELKEVLENGVSEVLNGSGRFPQIAGMRFSYLPFNPLGEQVANIKIQGEPLDPDRDYTIVTNSYLRRGGDGYRTFLEAREAYDLGPDIADLVAGYLGANRPYMPFRDDRIELLYEQ
ncbi:MAG: 5'-nucleotidase C-terminal domain-containing protein [Pseudomonadota bacterium]